MKGEPVISSSRPVVPHDSARTHVVGESVFVDDRLALPNELHVAVIFSPHAKARIKSIPYEKISAVPGVEGVYSARDLHHNKWGTIFQDQPVLAEDIVEYAGEPVLLIAAQNKEALRAAKKAAQVEYEVLSPVLSIDEAIRAGHFIGPVRRIQRGDFKKVWDGAHADHKIEGHVEMAGQDHFYLESQASIAYPGEGGQILVHSSSQHPTEVQHVVAHALGLKYSDVVCVVKRMGGAFGGKESQAAPFAAMAALVTLKTGRPARVVLSKDDDMKITGKRNPFKIHYRVAFDQSGAILGLEAKLFSDAGAYADLSTAIMERAMLHCDNAYFIPNVDITGTVCRTNTASNTAFRGFGGPKGVLLIENIIEEIAFKIGMDAFDVRMRNCYKDSADVTPYGQKIVENPLPVLFKRIEESANYRARRREIDLHNSTSQETFRGLSVTAVKFGISFTTRFLNQGSALVNVHLDGTVQVSTGATEMGQGVNVKIAQVVAEAFGLDCGDIRVMETSTEKNHNTSPTAASSGADINCAAAFNACNKIKARLAQVALQVWERAPEKRGRPVAGAGTVEEIKIRENFDQKQIEEWLERIEFAGGWVIDRENPSRRIRFVELLEEAYLNRVSLGEYGYFRYENIFFNKETGQGQPFFYYTNGVAVSEVSLNRKTGELKVLRSDILMDLGRPINEGVDRGQVIGGFVQGMGWLTTENLVYDQSGRLLTYSPSTYKIPSVHDGPRELKVDLLDNPNNSKNIKGSKAVGEPPLLLAISVWTAVKNALYDAQKLATGRRSQYGGNDVQELEKRWHKLKVPATQEEIFWRLPQPNEKWICRSNS